MVDGYRYTKNRTYKENVYYRCVEQSTCSARTLDFEVMANLNSQINTLSKMSRLSRQKANRNPPVPTSLENLAIPPSYKTNNQGENMLLWDSSYTEERRRTLMFENVNKFTFSV